MSTNRTENYQLHIWETEDEERLGELNENFAKLDETAVRIITGTYTGSGTIPQEIDLGEKPRAVLVMGSNGQTWYATNNMAYGGLVLEGHPVGADLLVLTATGFRAVNKRADDRVNSDIKYYIAFL